MQADRWKQIEDIFQSALDCDADKRASLLDSACGGDRGLRSEIESLLASHERAAFTSAPAFADGIKLLEHRAEPLHEDSRIGPYRVVREIGHGGMGNVYLAARADDAYQKLVAIKIIRRGLDTDDIIQRFRGERQILASLDHPNITRLLDAGSTDDGLPFFVMEYIEGEPIDEFCDARKLNITERLKLFQQVCAAVRYAHQNLVIHRDIKSGNVLVTKAGVPRLLDFGIAKLLGTGPETRDTTVTLARRLTPEYASPEQLRGELITTASDVYSLGVLLYRLLTGSSPYNAADLSPGQLERVICVDEPRRPSAVISSSAATNIREGSPEKLRRRLKGDLDNIVLMSLRKEPHRRYASAEQFSEDITRHLSNLPVIARPDTVRYRAGKFIVRHRTGVAAAAALVFLLIAGVVATSWQARVARVERTRAQQQFNDVRKLTTSFLFEFNDSIQNLPGATPARKLLVQRALEYLSKLAQQSKGDVGLQREVAEAYLKVGDLQGNPYEPNLGDTHGAEGSYRKALAISTALVHANEKDKEALRYLARSYQSLGEVLPILGNPTDGIANLRKAAGIFEALVRSAPRDKQLSIQLADCYQSLGDLQGHSGLQNLGDRAGALESYRKAVAIFDGLALEDSSDVKARGGAAVMRVRVGDMQQMQGDLDGALENYRGALERAESLFTADSKNDRFRRILALSFRKLADVENQKGDQKQALENARKAADINEALAAADPDNAQAKNNYALSLTMVADLLNKTGDRSGSIIKYQQAIAILDRLTAAAPSDLFMRGRLSETLIALGNALAQRKNLSEARAATSRGLGIEKDLASRNAATPDELSQYAFGLLTCQPRDLRQPATALEEAKLAVQKSASKDPKNLDILAQAYFQNGDSSHAIETEKKALDLLPRAQPHQNPSPTRQRFEAQLAKFSSGRH
jgi:non-specific serine/threonine protein kinase/serine/threonine-protein kinase